MPRVKRSVRKSSPAVLDAIVQYDVDLLQLVERFAVNDRVKATGVVSRRSVDVGAAGGRCVESEEEPLQLKLPVAGIDSHSGLRADPMLFPFGLEQVMHALGGVHHKSGLTG